MGNMEGWESHLHLSLHLDLFIVGHQAIHSISGLVSHPLLHRALPHNSLLLHSKCSSDALDCIYHVVPALSSHPVARPQDPRPAESSVSPSTQRDSPLSLPAHPVWHSAQSKPTARYSIFSMTCRAAAKVGSSEQVPPLSWPVPALGTWIPVLTPLRQHLPVEDNFWRPVRV